MHFTISTTSDRPPKDVSQHHLLKYDEDCYAQIEGVAMGSPVSPIVCNLFMERFEVKTLDSYSDPLWFWGRYVDDGVAVIKTSTIESFTFHLSSQH